MALAVTVPDTLEMIVGEQLNLTVDFTNLIAAGDAISSPTVIILNEAVNEFAPTAIIGVPFTSNSVTLNVTVTSAPLRPGATYLTTFSCVATGGTGIKNVSAALLIKVIY